MQESLTNVRPENKLPPEQLRRASLEGDEYAWRIIDIPSVIEAARLANLVNIGGQLQFRAPGATCECYWVEVDTYQSVSMSLPRAQLVAETARVAQAEFAKLLTQFDFFEEGRKTFPAVFAKLSEAGYDPREAMCFVWYLEAPDAEAPSA